MKEKIITGALIPQCLHTIFCGTITVFAIISAYLYICGSDGVITVSEIKNSLEYFFICITEILFFSLSFDIIFKYEIKNREKLR